MYVYTFSTSDKTSKYFDLRLLGVLMDSLQSAEEFCKFSL